MSACNEIQKSLPISPGDVSPEELQRITEHLKSCPECRILQEQLQALDDATAGIEIPDPGDGYWEDFAERVRQRAVGEKVTPVFGGIRRFVLRPSFGWPAAVAALLLVFFISRAMITDGDTPIVQPEVQPTMLADAYDEPLGPGIELQPTGVEIATIEPRSEPGDPGSTTPVTEEAIADGETSPAEFTDATPVATVEETPQETAESVSTAPGEETPGVLAMDRDDTEAEDFPLRQTIILQGDTVETQLSKEGLPSEKELASMERPNVPLPVDDTLNSSEAEKVLATQGTQEYFGVNGELRPLNNSEFTEEDRIFIEGRIVELSREVAEKKGRSREDACRQLVNMYYQLALHWQVQSNIRRALEFMDDAHDILPKSDHPDLESKAAALKPMLEK